MLHTSYCTFFFFSSRRRHTRCALVTGVQTCALPILARSSPHINQRSGVSVRFTVTNHEVMVANAARRALRHGEREVSPRVSDLEALPASMMGKIEIEALEEGRDAQIAEKIGRAHV